jgi:ferredoxin-NADP reductase
MLSPSVRSLVFRIDSPEPFAFEPGQYVDLLAPAERGLLYRRSYSIASPPSRSPEIEIAVTLVEGGPLSTALHAMPTGAHAEIEGPFGAFTRPPAHRMLPAAFVATGTGLAPFRAMLEAELADEPHVDGPPLVVLFGCRTEADILWGDELRAMASQSPRLSLHVTLSRPSPAWHGRSGYVQRHLNAIVPPLLPAHAYVCGLSKMVDEVVVMLERSLAMPRHAIHYETYD